MQVPRWRGSTGLTHSCLTSGLDGSEWSASCSAPPPQPSMVRIPGTHWIGGWVGLTAGLDTEARGYILGLWQGLNLCCPVCSQTLYWLNVMVLQILISKTEEVYSYWIYSLWVYRVCVYLLLIQILFWENLKFIVFSYHEVCNLIDLNYICSLFTFLLLYSIVIHTL
jgi:hypothetical protein